ncbi:MAG: hypothetical protein J6A30_09550 [Ruminococcus sp.]|nr:hypothetical protein [Ruminococcus sp.]
MDEYISKKEVLDYLNGYLHSLGYDNTDLIVNGQRHALINVLEDILTVKAADVQPEKHGRWIDIYEWAKMHDSRLSGMCTYYWCSECQKGQEKKSNFCPNCGARMNLGDDEK